MSGVAFHACFLELLTASTSSDSTSSPLTSGDRIVHTPNVALLPSLEEALPLPISWGNFATTVYKMLFSSPDPTLYTGGQISFSPANPPKTRLSVIHLPASTATRLAQLCRQQKSSVTSLLIVLIAQVLARQYPESTEFCASVPISLRRFTDIGNRQMVNYVSSVTPRFSTIPAKPGHLHLSLNPTASSQVPWDVIRSCRGSIDRVASSPSDHHVAWLRYVSDYFAFYTRKVGKRREASFEVSNLGLVDGVTDGGQMEDGHKVRCTRMTFSQSVNVVGPLWVFSVATVKGGDMTVALTWQEGLLRDEEVDRVMAELQSELTGLGNTQEG